MTLPESSLEPPLPYKGLSPPADPTAWCFLFLCLPASCRWPSHMSSDVIHKPPGDQSSCFWCSLLLSYTSSEDVNLERHNDVNAIACRNAQKRSTRLVLHVMLNSAPARTQVGPYTCHISSLSFIDIYTNYNLGFRTILCSAQADFCQQDARVHKLNDRQQHDSYCLTRASSSLKNFLRDIMWACLMASVPLSCCGLLLFWAMAASRTQASSWQGSCNTHENQVSDLLGGLFVPFHFSLHIFLCLPCLFISCLLLSSS